MSVNGISDVTAGYTPAQTASAQTSQASQESRKAESKEAAVYERSKDTSSSGSVKKTYKKDTATIEQMKADAEQRSQQLRSLVEKIMAKQGQTFNNATDMYRLLREGKLTVDPETAAQAQKDIADDGYWGVEQTSDRLVSFAKALSGGDPSKAEELMAAVKKGFKQATKTWGDELPDLCKRTLDATMEKMEKWKNGIEDTDTSKAEE